MPALTLIASLLVAQIAQTAAPPRATPEAAVSALMEELRQDELALDADALARHLAYSLTVIEGGSRVSGSFAYVEPLRRLRERHGQVKELHFEDLVVRVYGGSAVASYRIRKTWVDKGARHREEGWCSDVFERRDDGAWLLIHRQRP
jgi:ketosteroid isomerase-like protein